MTVQKINESNPSFKDDFYKLMTLYERPTEQGSVIGVEVHHPLTLKELEGIILGFQSIYEKLLNGEDENFSVCAVDPYDLDA